MRDRLRTCVRVEKELETSVFKRLKVSLVSTMCRSVCGEVNLHTESTCVTPTGGQNAGRTLPGERLKFCHQHWGAESADQRYLPFER